MRYQKKKNWKYRNYERVTYQLFHSFGRIAHPFFKIDESVLTIEEGYCWDGATGIPDTKKNFVPAQIHDVLAQAIREGLISIDRFEDANEELNLQYLHRDGWSWWGRVLEWGTNTFGKRYFKSDIIEVK